MALRDLATQPEIHITSEVLRRILFHPENYVQEAELVPQPEEHDYTGHPHSKCMDSPASFGAVCFYHALLKICVPGEGIVVYRINSHDPEKDTWTAAWPD